MGLGGILKGIGKVALGGLTGGIGGAVGAGIGAMRKKGGGKTLSDSSGMPGGGTGPVMTAAPAAPRATGMGGIAQGMLAKQQALKREPTASTMPVRDRSMQRPTRRRSFRGGRALSSR